MDCALAELGPAVGIDGVSAVREENGSDWLIFFIPLGALERADPSVRDGAPWAWCKPIDSWLAEAGKRLYAAVDYQLGLIGQVASGGDSAARILAEGPPQKRVYGYLVPADGRIAYLPGTG